MNQLTWDDDNDDSEPDLASQYAVWDETFESVLDHELNEDQDDVLPAFF